MPGWIWHCWPTARHVAPSAARVTKRAFVARPRVARHAVIGRAVRRLPHVAAAAGKGVSGAAVATGTALACGWVLAPPDVSPSGVPQVGIYGPGVGWSDLPGYLGLGAGVWPCGWCGGPVPGDAVPPVVTAGDVPPGPVPGPGPVPPNVVVVPPVWVPPGVSTPPQDVTEPSALAVLTAGLFGLVWVRRAIR